MRAFLKSILAASSKEVMGLSLLILIILLSLLGPFVYSRFTRESNHYMAEDMQLLDSLVNLIQQENLVKLKSSKKFLFDPNKASIVELVSLGIRKDVAGRVVKYREKGGIFYAKKDLYKIYGIDSSLVSDLYEFISLPLEASSDNNFDKKLVTEEAAPLNSHRIKEAITIELPLFDINEADTSVLKTINGIGSVFSKRIIDFRKKLGGFVSLEQLYTIYNLDSAIAEKLIAKSYISINFRPVPLLINVFSKDSLAGHPYISWQQARLIAAYRSQHGAFSSAAQLIKVYSIEEKDIEKLLPYIGWARTN